MTPDAATEAEGIARFAAAFENYFAESVVGLAPVVQSALAPATAAMEAAMAGVVAVDGGAGMYAGIAAFWGALPAIAPVVWPLVVPPLTTTVTPPPGLTTLQANITAVGVANIAGGLSLIDAADAMATAIHAGTTGGTATNTATPPVAVPIL